MVPAQKRGWQMILQPLIASLNPESLSMPTGTLRNRDASFSSLFLPLPLPLSLYPSSPISLHPHQPSIRFHRDQRSLSLSPFLVLPGGNEKRALWTGPMVLDERYPLPARRTKLRSHRKRRNIVIAATIPSPLHPPRLCRDIYRRRTESFRRTTGKRPLFNRLQHA